MAQNQDPNPLISVAPEGLRYQDRSPEKDGLEKALSSRTACKLEYRKLQPHEWPPGQLSGHRWLFTAHWQSESLKGKEAGNLSHLKLSHLGQELPYCVPSLLTQSSVCYQKLLKQVSAFSSGSLSSIWNQSCQYPDRKTQGKGRARLGWLA